MTYKPGHPPLPARQAAEVCGVLERITFQNKESGYTVARLQVQDQAVQAGSAKTAIVVGHLAGVPVGSTLQLAGDWDSDPRYGRQFKVRHYAILKPNTLNGIERYLGSGLIKGIGPSFARRIVKHFGLKTLEVLEQDPERLNEVPGLGRKRIAGVKKAWSAHKDIHQVMVFLQAHGISATYAVKIYRTYGAAALEKVKADPYRLAEDIWGVGFRIADSIAQSLGVPANDLRRVRAGLLFALQEAANNGHCYLPGGELLEAVGRLLDIQAPATGPPGEAPGFFLEKDEIKAQITGLIDDGKIVADQGNYYLFPIYHAEAGAAAALGKLLQGKPSLGELEAKRALAKAERSLRISLAPEQAEAISTALRHKVMVLTGGPGTGKSTILKGVILVLQDRDISVRLAAPTGRAAKRLSQTSGREAMTIHRLLEFEPSSMGFKRNSENPLEEDFVIIDEASMMDILLTNALLKAVRPGAALLLVGDAEQLPSVGPGNVLRDVIDSGAVPVVRLSRIYRQDAGSLISLNAALINSGKSLELLSDYQGEKDFYCIFRDDPEAIEEEVVSLCQGRLTRKFGFEPLRDIQVLTPMRKGVIGTEHLNNRLQAALNRNYSATEAQTHRFLVGDKVMQIRNNYDKDVFNGDLGIVSALDQDAQVARVNFDGRPVEYDFADFNQLVLAYAVTVHKSQGSEFPCVVLPIHTTHYPLLQRNLLYTAVTRGKKMVVMVGSKKAIAMAVGNNRVENRHTGLKGRIMQ